MATNREKYIDKLSDKELGELLRHRCYIDPIGKIKTEPIENTEGDSIEIYKWLSQEAKEDKEEKTSLIYPKRDKIPNVCKEYKSVFQEYPNNNCEDCKLVPNCKNHSYHIENIVKQIKWITEEGMELEKWCSELSHRLDKLEKCNRIAEVKAYIDEELKEKTKDMFKNMQPITKEYAEELVNKTGLCVKEVRHMNKTADQMFEELGYIKEGKFSGCIAYWCDKYKRRITINWGDEYEKATDFEYQKSIGENSVSDTITEAEDKAIHKKIEELKNEK